MNDEICYLHCTLHDIMILYVVTSYDVTLQNVLYMIYNVLYTE